ncbi:hypothetical protein GGR56DRAFT_619721 [Xylariaceae sp. FL0804]|nr:hypothetical protein GGR56DRAFT_619721 [Xylariaceae sp. FL0804]
MRIYHAPLILSLLGTRLALGCIYDFSEYPQAAQECLGDAALSSPCCENTQTELYACFCTNIGGFVSLSAACIEQNASSTLRNVYSELSLQCSDKGTPLNVTQAEWFAMADADDSDGTTSTSSPTASPTSSTSLTSTSIPASSTTTTSSSPTAQTAFSGTATPGQQHDDTSSALSTGAKAGLGLGVVFGAAALALGAWFVWAYSRRRDRHGGRDSGPGPDGLDGGDGGGDDGPGFAERLDYPVSTRLGSSPGIRAWSPAMTETRSHSDNKPEQGYAPVPAEMPAEGYAPSPVEMPAEERGGGGSQGGGPTPQSSPGLSSGVLLRTSNISPLSELPSETRTQ